jgi:hypothetical protein
MKAGGTAKAEAAKLQDEGISLKQCPEKMSGRKRLATELGKSLQREFVPFSIISLTEYTVCTLTREVTG